MYITVFQTCITGTWVFSNPFFRFKKLIDYYKNHHDDLEVDVDQELERYKVYTECKLKWDEG